MKVITARNVHEALPKALDLLRREGVERDSRNGPVIVAPYPVATVYQYPLERVIFHPERDANPFFHLYEALWMLSGRNDVAGPARYAKRMETFSDDGKTLHGAYGHRWRHFPTPPVDQTLRYDFDQLAVIAKTLKANPEDRRCVLQMWDAPRDLGRVGKDVPCNLMATFQQDYKGKLDLSVFCRSNDIIWGCYGANAVHFSFLLEYMARWIGCRVGTYTQMSVNWHAYKATWIDQVLWSESPYGKPVFATGPVFTTGMESPIKRIDEVIKILLEDADSGFSSGGDGPDELWASDFYYVLRAHDAYKNAGPLNALDWLAEGRQNSDWIVAAREWIERRANKV